MIIDEKEMQMEERDWNYIMRAYLSQYLFNSRGKRPEKVVFPMFSNVDGIPVEYVPELSAISIKIKKDGSNVPEITEEEEAALDATDAATKVMTKQESKPAPTPTVRQPKLPDRPITGTGVSPDNMGKRDETLSRQIARDLQNEPEIDESKQKPIKLTQDESGNKVLE